MYPLPLPCTCHHGDRVQGRKDCPPPHSWYRKSPLGRCIGKYPVWCSRMCPHLNKVHGSHNSSNLRKKDTKYKIRWAYIITNHYYKNLWRFDILNKKLVQLPNGAILKNRWNGILSIQHYMVIIKTEMWNDRSPQMDGIKRIRILIVIKCELNIQHDKTKSNLIQIMIIWYVFGFFCSGRLTLLDLKQIYQKYYVFKHSTRKLGETVQICLSWKIYYF